MKTQFYLGFFVAFFLLNFVQKEQQSKGKIYLNVDGFENNDGKLMIALSNSEESYSNHDQVYRGSHAEIINKKARYVFDDVPLGTYAIKVFHDENNNDELDFNFMHLPQEAYGFSNNARGTFGPASWEDAKFELVSDSLSILITVE